MRVMALPLDDQGSIGSMGKGATAKFSRTNSIKDYHSKKGKTLVASLRQITLRQGGRFQPIQVAGFIPIRLAAFTDIRTLSLIRAASCLGLKWGF